MSSHKIISVKVVEGNVLESYWKNNMQEIETDKGKFIDTFSDGFPWYNHVGEVVDDVKIYESKGYQWLKKTSEQNRLSDSVKPSSDPPCIDIVWARIESHAGETFHIKTKKEFTYTMDGEKLRTTLSSFDIPKSDFAKVLTKVPLDGPKELTDLFPEIVDNTSYIWGILHDDRIKKDEW